MNQHVTRCSRLQRWLAAGVACLLLAACTSGTPDDSLASGGADAAGVDYRIGIIGEQQPASEPVRGGTLTYAANNEPDSLDPAVTASDGGAGGSVLAPLYGVLMRYDPETKSFEPRLAKSLKPSDGRRTWTLRLRKGVRFSDGSVLDAEAVVASIRYYLEHRGYGAVVIKPLLQSMEITDPRTVVFHLAHPWGGVPRMLALGPGMVVAPSARQGEEFRPIGAGPFTLVRRAPNEEIVMASRSDYWDGEPYLEKLRFIFISGADARLDLLHSGAADVVFLADPAGVEQALKDGHAGFMSVVNQGYALSINTREGRPGERKLVRRAIALAIDPEVIYQRAFGGAGLPGKALFSTNETWTSRWHVPEVEPPPLDQAKARQLLEQAMAKGYDGRINYLASATQSGKKFAVAVEAMLEKVGFTVKVEYFRGSGVRRIFIEHDWDLVRGGTAIPEGSPYWQMYTVWNPGSPYNISGYSSPTMERLLTQFREATTYETKLEVVAEMEKEFWSAPPYIPLAADARFMAWGDDVHGVVPTASRLLLFSEAWLEEAE